MARGVAAGPRRPHNRQMSKSLVAGTLALLLSACAGVPLSPVQGPSAPATPASTLVAETWITTAARDEELDSVVAWPAPDGATWLLATGKSTHRLSLYDGDTGGLLRRVGDRGEAAGAFNRPNGIATHGDVLFVVERDNHRVQLLSLPGLEPLATFGQDELRSPYGIWLHETAPSELEAFVTDSFMYGERYDVVPPAEELAQRVRRYRLRFDDQGHAEVDYLGSFGQTDGPARLDKVESIAGDPVHERLLVAEEAVDGPSNIHVYDLAGRWTGRSMPEGTFAGEAEGVVLWSCGASGGYWLAVDQQAPLTRFHLFRRDDLSPVGSFHGAATSNTDGVTLHAAATRRFPGGVLYAVHDDRAVAAFDLRDVVDALGLDRACLH